MADDVFKSLRDGLTYKGQLYSLPFYGESTFTIYRTDLFKTAGLSMPEKPTWSQVEQLAAKINVLPTASMASACAASLDGARTWAP